MGLDITAYEIATLTPEHEVDWEVCYDKGHREVGSFDFPISSRGLVENRCYLVEGRTVEFRAGSYSGYGEWRNKLAVDALGVADVGIVWLNKDEWVEAPFFELLNFSDCEGAIGPEACVDLAADFLLHRDRLRSDDEWFDNLYDTWGEAFALAANTGLVYFH